MTTEELNQLIYGVEAESRIGETALDILREIDDVDSLFTIISDESPQTIAMIASYMKPEEASKLLALLPEEKMINTVIGIASLEQFDSEVMQNVSNLLRIKLDTMSNSSLNKTDGIKKCRKYLKQCYPRFRTYNFRTSRRRTSRTFRTHQREKCLCLKILFYLIT